MEITDLDPNTVNNGNTEAIITSGDYFLGDNCYTLGDLGSGPEWDQWVEVTAAMSDDFRLPISGAKIGGFPLIASSTAYGDGYYKDAEGNGYSVDAGIIGLTPLDFIKAVNANQEELKGLGRFITLNEDHVLKYNEGTITLTPVSGGEATYTIYTADED